MEIVRSNQESIDQIKNYIQLVSTKYLSSELGKNNDPYIGIAKNSFVDLRDKM